jgi:protein-L-isoaspartate(D-aspartate) O-methyltransferase
MVENQLKSRGISDAAVLRAMEKVPRHLFLPEENMRSAYEDGPLPIGQGQTMSQPYMVALMTQCLEAQAGDKILEIGTGSGYQAAVLLELTGEVYTIERVPELAARAEQTLSALGYDRFHMQIGDGSKGWLDAAPFDGIIVTAGAPAVPQALLDQLTEGGRLVIPVGSRFSQTLFRVRRTGAAFKEEEFTMCVFVPLVGEAGWKSGD